MGWSYPYSTQSRAQLIAYLRRPDRFGESLELVRACATGSHHWYLVRVKATGMHWIGLDLMQGSRGEGWGYKDLDESVGPCALDCPLAYLKAPHEPRDGWALKWRQSVQDHHRAKHARPVLAPGVRVMLGKTEYELVTPRKSRTGRAAGWYVIETATGIRWAMTAKQAARVTLSPEKFPGMSDDDLLQALGVAA